jgi:hypothetical protein
MGGRTVASVTASVEVEPSRFGGQSVQAQLMQLVQAMVDLVIDVEELAANGASSRALIHRVRAQARRVGLDPIDGAGEPSEMDRYRHRPVGAPIGDGAPVVVVRPGYIWRSGQDSVLVAKAVVQDRS